MVPHELIAALAQAGLSVPVDRSGLDEVPDAPGAYAVVLHLRQPVPLGLNAVSASSAPAGWHVYLGSARGPGGLRARLARHLRPNKKRHWHIDRLTLEADAILVSAVREGSECSLVDRLSEVPDLACLLPGFGSSDCRSCRGHLLSFQPDQASKNTVS